MAETFEDAGELLAGFSDEQLDLGFWYLLDDMRTLANEEIQLELRLRAVKSFVPLFEQVMAVRCTPHLSHDIVAILSRLLAIPPRRVS